MIIADEDILYAGTVYSTIGAQGETEEEYLYFAQPRDSKIKSQSAHSNALNELIESEEDVLLMKAKLEPNDPEV